MFQHFLRCRVAELLLKWLRLFKVRCMPSDSYYTYYLVLRFNRLTKLPTTNFTCEKDHAASKLCFYLGLLQLDNYLFLEQSNYRAGWWVGFFYRCVTVSLYGAVVPAICPAPPLAHWLASPSTLVWPTRNGRCCYSQHICITVKFTLTWKFVSPFKIN